MLDGRAAGTQADSGGSRAHVALCPVSEQPGQMQRKEQFTRGCALVDTERVLVGRPLTPGAGTGRVTSNLPIQHLHSRRPFSIAAYIRIMIPSLEKCAA